jgi:hypothetical protein
VFGTFRADHIQNDRDLFVGFLIGIAVFWMSVEKALTQRFIIFEIVFENIQEFLDREVFSSKTSRHARRGIYRHFFPMIQEEA